MIMTLIHEKRIEKTSHSLSMPENLHSKYMPFLERFGKHLLNEIGTNGYIQASSRYSPYKPHWIRDSSFIAISLFNIARFLRDADKESEAKKYIEAASRINTFNMNVIERRIERIKQTIQIPYEDERHYLLDSHIPARVGPSMDLFVDKNLNDITSYNKWLIQHDTVPLFIMSLESERLALGTLTNIRKQFLDSNAVTLGRYLNKIALTPSSNAWEMETDFMHPYTTSAIYAGKRSLARLLVKENPRLLGEHWEGFIDNTPIIEMLRLDVNNGVAYRRRKPFSDPDTNAGVDSEEIFMFSRFGISDLDIGAGVKDKTIALIEKDLFSGHMLPLRNLNDVYFLGGRWLLLGLEYARYLAFDGDLENASEIISYVLGKHSSSMPEQEIINPANPESREGAIDLQRNNGLPIQHLNWSYAAATEAMLSTINAARGHFLVDHHDSSILDDILRK
jgi:GH15 family glucan-1,4-alpha-glucosidase